MEETRRENVESHTAYRVHVPTVRARWGRSPAGARHAEDPIPVARRSPGGEVARSCTTAHRAGDVLCWSRARTTSSSSRGVTTRTPQSMS